MVDYRKVLALNVRMIRKQHGLSQEELALEAGIDRTYISGIERGTRNPSLDVMVLLARTLRCTLSELVREPAPEADQ